MSATTVTQLAKEFRQFVSNTEARNRSIEQKIDGLVEVIQNKEIMEAGRSHLFDKIKDHDITLYGDKRTNQPGHDQRLSKLEGQMNTAIKIVWFVLTPLLLAIGSGIAVLIYMGVKGGL